MSRSFPPSEPELIAQLRQSLGMLQVAFDAAAEAMLIVDGDRRIHWANQAAANLLLHGVPIALMNQKLADLLTLCSEDASPLDSPALLDPCEALPSRADQGRFVLRRSDGSITAVQRIRWQPVELVQAPFLLVSIRDLGPEEKALLQQQQFMVDLTHELRTPLAIVAGSLQRLSRQDPLLPQVRTGVAMAREEVERIHRLLGNLTLMTQLEVDASCLGLREHRLDSLLESWSSSLTVAQRERLRWSGTRGDSFGPLRVDANAFRLVLDQLLDNALCHGVKDQPVDIHLEAEGLRCCRITMGNLCEGGKVDEEVLRSWQAPFVRGFLSRDGLKAEGPGLGLALVRQLVDHWGGVLTVSQSQSASRTRMEVTLTVPFSSNGGS